MKRPSKVDKLADSVTRLRKAYHTAMFNYADATCSIDINPLVDTQHLRRVFRQAERNLALAEADLQLFATATP